jgi:serine acetyltransferase
MLGADVRIRRNRRIGRRGRERNKSHPEHQDQVRQVLLN